VGRRVDLNTLLVRWDASEGDFKVWFPSKPDGGFVLGHLCGDYTPVGRQICQKCYHTNEHKGYEETFLKELEKRGYDLTTLRFSIRKKQQ
jgi:hypothetical protein